MDVNALVKKVTSGAQGNHGTLSTVMGLMGGQNQAGFSNMLSSLNSSGRGDHVKSWVGTGVNQLVSSQQVTNWLGNDKLQQVGRAVGLSPNEVANHLAQQLPAFVDKLASRLIPSDARAWAAKPLPSRAAPAADARCRSSCGPVMASPPASTTAWRAWSLPQGDRLAGSDHCGDSEGVRALRKHEGEQFRHRFWLLWPLMTSRCPAAAI
jgi:uncharacterized protein YidB (DUF937 family)